MIGVSVCSICAEISAGSSLKTGWRAVIHRGRFIPAPPADTAAPLPDAPAGCFPPPPDPPASALPSTTDAPPAATGSIVRRPFPAISHRLWITRSACASRAGRGRHWRSPGVVVGVRGSVRPAGQPWRYRGRRKASVTVPSLRGRR